MELDKTRLMREIIALRVGAAARDPALLEQLGPQLRRLCEITDQDPPRQIVLKLRSTIERVLSDRLELRIILLAVLGLHPEAPYDAPPMRLRWAAGKLHLGCERTAYRRANEAIRVFAHLAAATAQASPETAWPGFTLKSFRGEITLIGDRPKFIQRREIVVTAEELPTIPGAFAILEPPPGYEPTTFDITVTIGGTRWYDIRRRGCKVEYWVKPWRTLRHGETHVFEVEFSLPDGRLVAPHNILTPLTTAHASEMVVTFDPTHLPAKVWRVNGVMRVDVDHCPSDNPDRLDPSGRIRAAFPRMQQGWSYGIAWSWA